MLKQKLQHLKDEYQMLQKEQSPSSGNKTKSNPNSELNGNDEQS